MQGMCFETIVWLFHQKTQYYASCSIGGHVPTLIESPLLFASEEEPA